MILRKTASVSILAFSCMAAFFAGTTLKTASAKPTEAMPAPKGKITPWQAIKIANTKVSGRALQANFEFDEGKWVYGVMIVSGGKLQEVEIDPTTGKIGDVEAVTPSGEAKEVEAELNKALGNTAPTPTGGEMEKGEGKEKD